MMSHRVAPMPLVLLLLILVILMLPLSECSSSDAEQTQSLLSQTADGEAEIPGGSVSMTISDSTAIGTNIRDTISSPISSSSVSSAAATATAIAAASSSSSLSLSPSALSSWSQVIQYSKVLLSELKAILLRRGRVTTGRRSAGVPHLSCVGGNACGRFLPDKVLCLNMGLDAVTHDVHWRCRAHMPPEYRFGRIMVSCEGFDFADDQYVLEGSCGLEYTLEFTPKGLQRNTRDVVVANHSVLPTPKPRASSLSTPSVVIDDNKDVDKEDSKIDSDKEDNNIDNTDSDVGENDEHVVVMSSPKLSLRTHVAGTREGGDVVRKLRFKRFPSNGVSDASSFSLWRVLFFVAASFIVIHYCCFQPYPRRLRHPDSPLPILPSGASMPAPLRTATPALLQRSISNARSLHGVKNSFFAMLGWVSRALPQSTYAARRAVEPAHRKNTHGTFVAARPTRTALTRIRVDKAN